MPARRRAAAVALLGTVPLALAALGAVPAAAHGAPCDPVGRVSQRCTEGPGDGADNMGSEGRDPARADRPATRVRGGSYPFGYRASASRKGTHGSAPYLVMGGAAALALCSAALFGAVRRRSGSDDRHER